MAETKITFQSSGFKLAGTVRVPDGVKPGERRPAFIVMHGFGSNSSSSNVLEPCKMFEKLGYVTLRIDMPGCGESEGPRGNLICLEQVQAASDALTFLAKHPNVEGDRIGMIGSSFGAAIAVYVCGVDKRVAAAISSGGWGDGERKFRGQHPGAAAWKKFTDMLAEGKRHREKTGQSLMVPRYDIVPIPRASARPPGAELDPEFTAETAQSMYDFRADDVIGKAAGRPILLLHSSVDSVTPTEQSIEMFKRAAPAVRPAPVRRDRPLHVRGEQHPRPQRDLRLAGQVFPGPGARGGGVTRMAESRRFPIAAMLAFTRDALLACGVPAADAEIAAKQMIEADLTGFDAHGIFRLSVYCETGSSPAGSIPRPTSRCCSARPRPRWSTATTASAIW